MLQYLAALRLALRPDQGTPYIFDGMAGGWNQDASVLPEYMDIREMQRELESKSVEVATVVDEQAQCAASFAAIERDGNPMLVDQHVSSHARESRSGVRCMPPRLYD